MESVYQFALQLTVTGIGLVFLLLGLLWGLIALLLRLDRPAAGPVPSPALDLPAPSESLSPDLGAAILIAVLSHRAERRKEAGPEVRSRAPGSQPSRWLMAGRTRQNQSWQPRRSR